MIKNRPAAAKRALVPVSNEKIFVPRPTATAIVDPMGRRTDGAREHLVKVAIELNATDERFSDKAVVTATARRALNAYAPGEGQCDPREFREITASSRGKAGTLVTVVVGVECTVTLPDRPTDESIEMLRATLLGEGYRVTVKERRECLESAACSTDAMVVWKQVEDVPTGWFSSLVCGRHDYRRCAKCKSVYRLTSTNTARQAPSVHCEVCGIILVEWGSSKVWNAELVTRGPLAGEPPVEPPAEPLSDEPLAAELPVEPLAAELPVEPTAAAPAI